MPANFDFFRLRQPVVILAMVLAFSSWGSLLVGNASAQLLFPRLGLSVAPDEYVAEMNTQLGDTFTLYVGAFGTEAGMPLEEDMISMGWAVYQVCCGADLLVVDFEFVGEFESTGHPLAGVNSVAPACVSADFITLAELRVTLLTPDGGSGEFLITAGPNSALVNCAGENPIFLEGVVTVIAGGEITPVVETTWSGLKAIFR